MDQRAPLPDRQGRTQRLQLREAQRADAERRAGLGALSRIPTWSFTTIPESTRKNPTANATRRFSFSPSRRWITAAMATATRSACFPGGLTKLEGAFAVFAERRISDRAGHPFVRRRGLSLRQLRRRQRQVYFGSYEFLPSDRPFRAPIVTPKPLIHGIQTAKVVTKDDNSSEEIDVEALGEIYVRFYWDRKKKRSCKAARRAGLVRQALGRPVHTARRTGSRRRISRRRSRSSAGDRHRL